MSAWVIGLLLTTGLPFIIGIVIALFAKKFPKEQFYNDKIKPFVIKFAKICDSFLDLKLGKVTANKIEESIFCTIAYWLENSIKDFYSCLIEDNKEDQK
jgi:hypothetical protein